MVKTWVPVVYLKMTGNTVEDSFSEGTFLLRRLDNIIDDRTSSVWVDISCTVANFDQQATFERKFEGKSL